MTTMTKRYVIDGLNLITSSSEVKEIPFLEGSAVFEQKKIGPQNDVLTILTIIMKDDSINEKDSIEMKKLEEKTIYLSSGIITCFRLEKRGGIGYHRGVDNDVVYELSFYGLPYRKPKDDPEPTFNISSDQLSDIKKRIINQREIIEREQIQHQSLFRCALSWYNRFYNEQNRENMLVDLMICFEILFVRGAEESSNKGENIKTRATPIFESDSQVALKIMTDLEIGYKIRNCVAHEGRPYDLVYKKLKLPGETRSSIEFLYSLQDYARRAIKEYFQRILNGNLTPKEVKEIICSQNTSRRRPVKPRCD